MTRHFCMTFTEEGAIRFAFLRKMHGFLIDRRRKKAYAIVKDAAHTDWPGRFARCYVIDERHAQTVQFDPTNQRTGEVRFKDVARMVKPVTPTPDAPQGVLELTADVLYDAVDGLLVRRLGLRRPTWIHAILFAGTGGAIAFVLWALARIWTV